MIKVISNDCKIKTTSNKAVVLSQNIPTNVVVSANVGLRGFSEFEIAQRNGFEGTEQEWLDRRFDDIPDSVIEDIAQRIQEEDHILFNTLPELP